MDGGLGIDWKILLGQIVNFLILFWLLKRFAYKPFLSVLQNRQKKIEEGVAKSKQAEESLVKIRALGEEVKSASEKKAKELVAEAQIKAQDRAAMILAAAEEEKKKVIESARAAAKKELIQEQERLSREALDLAMTVAEKFLGEKITKEQDRKLIENMAAKL